MRTTLMTFGTCLFMASCAAAPPKETPMETTLTLLPKASAALALTPPATLHFDRIEDSRCPPDVRCITAGRLRYHFTLSAPQARDSFTLDTDAPSSSPAGFPQLRITLVSADAPAARPSTAAGPAPVFPVTLRISANASQP